MPVIITKQASLARQDLGHTHLAAVLERVINYYYLLLITRTACLQEDGSGLSASRTSGEAQSAYAALLEQAVSQLQLLGGETGGSTSSRKAQQAAQERLYGLLEALAQVSAVQSRGLIGSYMSRS